MAERSPEVGSPAAAAGLHRTRDGGAARPGAGGARGCVHHQPGKRRVAGRLLPQRLALRHGSPGRKQQLQGPQHQALEGHEIHAAAHPAHGAADRHARPEQPCRPVGAGVPAGRRRTAWAHPDRLPGTVLHAGQAERPAGFQLQAQDRRGGRGTAADRRYLREHEGRGLFAAAGVRFRHRAGGAGCESPQSL